jgi:hypothetical protein
VLVKLGLSRFGNSQALHFLCATAGPLLAESLGVFPHASRRTTTDSTGETHFQDHINAGSNGPDEPPGDH